MDQRISVGRIVHYVRDDGRHLAAIVTECDESGQLDIVSLVAFHPRTHPAVADERMAFYHGVFHGDPSQTGTWHWPERV